MLVRKLEQKDSLVSAELIKQLTPNIVEPEKLAERISFLAVPNNWQYFVAEEDGKIVGFGGLTWYFIPSKGKVGWVEEIVVDEASRGKGIGKMLMETILDFGKEQGLIRLQLTVNNFVAENMYQKLGFKNKETEVMYYNY